MNKLISIKDLVKDNKKVKFLHYKDGDLWYMAEGGFTFPVPVSDVGTATMLNEDKAILFMRYMNKYIKTLEELV